MKDDGLVIKVATGILLAFLVIGGLRACQEQMAVNALAEQMNAMNEGFASDMRRQQVESVRRQEQARAAAAQQQAIEAASHALPEGHRCIGKDLFRRVDNGWVQVTDGSAKQICSR